MNDASIDAVLTLGDNQYENGELANFQQAYDASWGRVKAITRPTPGNHEYQTAGASGYFSYFGTAAGSAGKGYYSYDLGAWHLIALNSEIDVSAGSAQDQWLRSDLAAHSNTCTLAYWHHPRFSSGIEHGNDPSLDPLWQALYSAGADVVLNGHDHDYERFAPQNPAGQADGNGIREFVVGTGGKNVKGFGTIRANSQMRGSTFGVLKLTLHATGYDWNFTAEAGKTFTDSGSSSCSD